MRAIWKYRLEVTTEQIVMMPQDARILSVAEQDGVPTVWALIESDAPLENVKFWIEGTGHPMWLDPLASEGLARFLGTTVMRDPGPLYGSVWHVWTSGKLIAR